MSNRYQQEKRASLEQLRKDMPARVRIDRWTLTMYLMLVPFQGKPIHCSLVKDGQRIEWDTLDYATGEQEARQKVAALPS